MSDFKYYILIGKRIVEVDLLSHGKWRQECDNHIGDTWLPGRVRVSTIFLGFDHGFGIHNSPVLFETMIFGGKYDQYQDRYFTYAGALAGHYKAVNMVKKYKRVAFAKKRNKHKNRFMKLPFHVQMRLKYGSTSLLFKNRKKR